VFNTNILLEEYSDLDVLQVLAGVTLSDILPVFLVTWLK